MNTAIIVAAGSGSRFNSETPKQFVEILGKPVIVRTLERFEQCSAIDQIVVVLAETWIERFRSISEGFELEKISNIVGGGSTRAESASKGLQAVNANSEIVAVHDGARPLVSVDEITRTVEAAREYGAACLVAPVTDTIKEIDGAKIVGTLDRSKLRRALTPQAFRYQILAEAFGSAELSNAVTDECFLVERLKQAIATVEGSPRNIKITHPQDLALAELYLRSDL